MAIITMYRGVGLTPPAFAMDNEIPTVVPSWLQDNAATSPSEGSDISEVIENVRKLVRDMNLTGGSAVGSFDLYSAILGGL